MADVREEIALYVTEIVTKELESTTLPAAFRSHIVEKIEDMIKTSKRHIEQELDISEIVAEETGLDVQKAGMMIECRYGALNNAKSVLTVSIEPRAHYVSSERDESIADQLYDYSDGFEFYTEIKYKSFAAKIIVEALNNDGLVVSETLDRSYRLIQANEDTIVGEGADKLIDQLKSEGKYNHWIGVPSNASDTSGSVSIQRLPVFGYSDRFETKWFYGNRADAIKSAKSELHEMGWY